MMQNFVFRSLNLMFFFQSGQRFDTNSANEGSTNKLETNGFSGTQQQQSAQQMYANNQGELNK